MVGLGFCGVFLYRGSVPKTDQMILCGVMDPGSGTNFTVVFVYAHNSEVDRRSLWANLVTVANNSLVSTSPLVILRDFNQILTANEHFPCSHMICQRKLCRSCKSVYRIVAYQTWIFGGHFSHGQTEGQRTLFSESWIEFCVMTS